MRQVLLVLTIGLLVVACATVPTAQEQMAADYGAPIAQQDAEALATAYLQAKLKDPMSAVYSWEPVTKGYMAGAPVAGRKLTFGYLLRGTVNAKNSFGGYTGAKPYGFVIRDGVIVGADREECLSAGSCYMAPF